MYKILELQELSTTDEIYQDIKSLQEQLHPEFHIDKDAFYFRKVLENPNNKLFVAMKTEAWPRIIGMCLASIFRNLSAEILIIDNVIVDIEYRGNGIASLLFDKAIEFGMQNNVEAIQLAVYKDNQAAINLYKKKKLEIWDHALIMGKIIHPWRPKH